MLPSEHQLDKEAVSGTQSLYGEAIKITENAPEDEYTPTPLGLIVPKTESWGKKKGSTVFGEVKVQEVKEDGTIVDVGVFNDEKGLVTSGSADGGESDAAPVEQLAPSAQPDQPAPAELDKTTKDMFSSLDDMLESNRQERAKQEKKKRVYVTLEGSFGQVVIPTVQAFKEGACIVLVTDLADGFAYTPPKSEEPFGIRVPNGDVFQVVYPGISYNVPESTERHTIFIEV